ncbi:MAG: hypothetical protein OXH00_02855 [Candidatus Poribacteria bacterium]|nr:hypothetical protein [Candidatus Poribacteria bacterium]
MTVKELKEMLEQYDDDMPVVVDREEYGYLEVERVERVTQIGAYKGFLQGFLQGNDKVPALRIVGKPF